MIKIHGPSYWLSYCYLAFHQLNFVIETEFRAHMGHMPTTLVAIGCMKHRDTSFDNPAD